MLDHMIEMLNDPSMRHAAFAHAPIGLAFLLLPMSLLALAMNRRESPKRWPRVLLLLSCVMYAVAAFMTYRAGFEAKGVMGDIPEASTKLIHLHARAAQLLVLFGYGSVLLTGLTFVPKFAVRSSAVWLMFFLSMAISWQVGVVAHKGGKAVYKFGVGTPNPLTERQLALMADDGNLNSELDELARVGDQRVVHFQQRVYPLLNDRCFGCHKSEGRNPIKLASFYLMQTTYDEPTVVVGDPEASILYQVLTAPGKDRMPKKGPAFTPDEMQVIHQWIKDGAVWVVPSTAVEKTQEDGDEQ